MISLPIQNSRLSYIQIFEEKIFKFGAKLILFSPRDVLTFGYKWISGSHSGITSCCLSGMECVIVLSMWESLDSFTHHGELTWIVKLSVWTGAEIFSYYYMLIFVLIRKQNCFQSPVSQGPYIFTSHWIVAVNTPWGAEHYIACWTLYKMVNTPWWTLHWILNTP